MEEDQDWAVRGDFLFLHCFQIDGHRASRTVAESTLTLILCGRSVKFWI